MLSFIKRLDKSKKKKALVVLYLAVFLIGYCDYKAGVMVSLVIFYLIPVSLCSIWVSKDSALVLSIVSVLVRFLGDAINTSEWWHLSDKLWLLLNPLFSLVIFITAVIFIDKFIKLNMSLEEKVLERTKSLGVEILKRENMQKEMLNVTTYERYAIGSDLHDTLSQDLTAATFVVKILKDGASSTKESNNALLSKIETILQNSIDLTRRMAHGLILYEIKPEDFVDELRALVMRLSKDAVGVNVELLVKNNCYPDSSLKVGELLRITQECVLNALKHSFAKNILVTLSGSNSTVILEVSDDGKGFDTSTASRPGAGIKIMQYRAMLIGAEITFVSNKEFGTHVVCRVANKQN